MTHRDPTADNTYRAQLLEKLAMHCGESPSVWINEVIRVRCPICKLMVESCEPDRVIDLWNRTVGK